MYPTPIGMRDAQAANDLRKICEELNLKNKIMIEIGSYTGDSAIVFAEFCKTVYCIDPWLNGMLLSAGTSGDEKIYMYPNVEKAFDEKTKRFANIVKLKGFDFEVVDNFANSFLDFIYIDSLHTEEETRRQLKLWLPKINNTGIIAGHDFNEHFPGIKKAVREVIGEPDKVYTDSGNSWMKYKASI
jgi:cephalosporin hydroxylase